MSIARFARLAPLSLLLALFDPGVAQAQTTTTPEAAPKSGSTPPPTSAQGPGGTTPPTGSTPVDTPKTNAAPPGTKVESAEASAQGTPGGLTAESAGTAAGKTAISVAIDQAKIAAAAAQVDAAWDAYWPRLSFTARYTRLSPIDVPSIGAPPGVYSVYATGPGVSAGPINPSAPGVAFVAANASFSFPVFLNQWTTQASLLVPLSDYVFRIYHQKQASIAALEAAKWNAKVNYAAAVTDARVAFYNVLRAQGAVVVAKSAVGQSEAHLKDLKNQFAAKVVTVADVARVEATLANAQLALIKSENLVIVTEANLRVLMHQTGDAPIVYGEDLTAELPKLETDLKTLKAQAFAKRPELKALDAQIASLEANNSVIDSMMYPRLDAIGNLTYANPNQRIFPQTQEWRATWDVSVQLTWSPNDALIAHDQKKVQSANVAALKATRDQINDALVLDITSAYTKVKEAEASVVTTATELKAAEEAYRVRKEQFALGATTSALLIDTEADLTRARLNHLNARVDLRVARAQLRRAVGDV